MVDRVVIRLQETQLPAGEIALADLASIAGKLQDLSTRVSRWAADIDGGGRGPRIVEAAAALRLSGIGVGSTVLNIERGLHVTLDFDLPFERDVSAKYWEIITGLGADVVPTGAPAAVRESAAELLDALQHAAPLVEISDGGGARVTFRPAERDRTVWQVPDVTGGAQPITVVGRLEAVDLRNQKLRIADDVGNRIRLEEVDNAVEISQALVGKRAVAAGYPTYDRRGRLLSIAKPTIEPGTVPEPWLSHQRPSRWSLPDAVTGPAPHGGAEFSDDEWDEFMAAVLGR